MMRKDGSCISIMFQSRLLRILLWLLLAFMSSGCGYTATSGSESSQEAASENPALLTPFTPRYTFRIIHIFPHDPRAFTQGLLYHNGRLYEGTGQLGRSSLRLVDPETGEVLRIHYLREQYFGEGIALYDGKIIQLTWQSHQGFIYDPDTFKELRTFPYSTEGWGITYDGKKLIVSDGSATLYYWDPQTLQETGRIEVRDQGRPVTQLNELEFVKGKIYANVWQTDSIAQIDPATGNVTGWIDLGELVAYMDPGYPIDVLNGIAYDSENDRLFVTGKLWPKLFEIECVPVDGNSRKTE